MATKATLLLTIPCFIFKSSAKDLTPGKLEIVMHRLALPAFLRQHLEPVYYDFGRLLVYACSSNKPRGKLSLRSSTDSDLEAFSHNPTDGSFAALAFQPTANTNYLNQRFLSY